MSLNAISQDHQIDLKLANNYFIEGGEVCFIEFGSTFLPSCRATYSDHLNPISS